MATAKTKPEPALAGFDAVAESRKWREATSRKLDAMSSDERRAYLAHAHERLAAGLPEKADAPAELAEEESCIVREDPPQP